MKSCETEIIFMKEAFIITYCPHCERIGMLFGQSMLSFHINDFRAFCRYVERMDFEAHRSPFFDGVSRIILETYHMDIQISLKEEEFDTLRKYLYETQLRLRIYNSLN